MIILLFRRESEFFYRLDRELRIHVKKKKKTMLKKVSEALVFLTDTCFRRHCISLSLHHGRHLDRRLSIIIVERLLPAVFGLKSNLKDRQNYIYVASGRTSVPIPDSSLFFTLALSGQTICRRKQLPLMRIKSLAWNF